MSPEPHLARERGCRERQGIPYGRHHAAFLAGAVFALAAALVGAALLCTGMSGAAHEREAIGVPAASEAD